MAAINYLRTGYRSDGMLDVHWVTDEDIEKQTSFAAKIGAVTDAVGGAVSGGGTKVSAAVTASYASTRPKPYSGS